MCVCVCVCVNVVVVTQNFFLLSSSMDKTVRSGFFFTGIYVARTLLSYFSSPLTEQTVAHITERVPLLFPTR